MTARLTILLAALLAAFLGGCAAPPKLPPEKPLQPAAWADLPGWADDDHRAAFEAFRASCAVLGRRELWKPACESAQTTDPAQAHPWFEANFRPWALVNPDGGRDGLVPGYYEPLLKGSRVRSEAYPHPVFGPPDDVVVVDLASLYPELKNLRLRGRIEGRRLIPYWSREEWQGIEGQRAPQALLWVDDPLDLFKGEVMARNEQPATAPEPAVEAEPGRKVRKAPGRGPGPPPAPRADTGGGAADKTGAPRRTPARPAAEEAAKPAAPEGGDAAKTAAVKRVRKPGASDAAASEKKVS